MIVFGIESGSYSDYSVEDFAFTDRRVAEAWAEMEGSDAQVMEIWVDPPSIDVEIVLAKRKISWKILFAQNGDVLKCEQQSCVIARGDPYQQYWNDGTIKYLVYVVADTRERAIKSGWEHVMQWKSTATTALPPGSD